MKSSGCKCIPHIKLIDFDTSVMFKEGKLLVLLAPKVADRPTPEEYLNRLADMRHPAQMQLVVRPRN
ncbi:hypothetical protein BDF22DRAFT_774134 [Syncephalis plumigaleata]|nr:hypothetical protein BDF22DRAFT_774134 [Syncephalis plumigaleata]